MKPFAVSVLLLGAACSVFAQGTVNFSNGSGELSSPPDRLIRWSAFPYSPGEPTPFPVGSPVGSNGIPGLRAQLYYGDSTASESSLAPVSFAPATFRSSTSPNAGTWFGGTRTLDGFSPGSTVNLQVRVWDISLASSFEASTALGGTYTSAIGISQIFRYTIPTSPFDLQAFNMNNFMAFTISQPSTIPEPTSIVLFVLGGVCGLGWLSRKNQPKIL